jgi:hypothetical protein
VIVANEKEAFFKLHRLVLGFLQEIVTHQIPGVEFPETIPNSLNPSQVRTSQINHPILSV